MRNFLLIAGLCCCLPMLPLPAKAAMYSYVDSKGVRHYTNVPGDGRYKLSETPAPVRAKRLNAEDQLLRTITSRSLANKSLASKPRSQATRQMYDLFYFTPGAAPLYDYSYSATPHDISKHIQHAAQTHRLDPMLIKAVIKTESNFNPNAISPKGAQGLMQLMPGTASDLKVRDPFDARQNIFGGAKYLRQMLDRFGGDVELCLAAYNAGPNRVAPLGIIPNIPETQAYVAKVLRHYKAYRNGKGSALVQHTRKPAAKKATLAQKTPSAVQISSIKVQQLVTVQ